jgi:hypothetical protein
MRFRVLHAVASALLVAAVSAAEPRTTAVPATALPFATGERLSFRISYLHLTAGHATLSIEPGPPESPHALRFVAEARSEGFFAWLLRFRVDDRTVAAWDPASGCSLGIEKHLLEGRARRDQTVVFDGKEVLVRDPKIEEERFEVAPCSVDVLSALYVARVRGVPATGRLELPAFDNGKRYVLGVRFLKRERLDLPLPLGRGVPVLVVEPQLVLGSGLFVREGRLTVWLTDDARRIPVRLRAKVPIGSVSADLESADGLAAP